MGQSVEAVDSARSEMHSALRNLKSQASPRFVRSTARHGGNGRLEAARAVRVCARLRGAGAKRGGERRYCGAALHRRGGGGGVLVQLGGLGGLWRWHEPAPVAAAANSRMRRCTEQCAAGASGSSPLREAAAAPLGTRMSALSTMAPPVVGVRQPVASGSGV